MKKCWIGFFIMMLSAGMSYAQNSGLYYLHKDFENEDPMDDVTHLDLGVNSVTNNVYLGRKDGSRVPYLTAYISYYNRRGFYFDAAESYAFTKKTGHFDLTTLSAGYDHTYGTNILAGVHAEKYIYYKNSPAVRSAITENAGVYCQYRNDLIEPTLAFDINNGATQDIVIKATLDHRFQLADKKLNIYPAFSFYMGTLHYYDQYFINRTLRNDNIVITNAIETPGKIKPVALELSAKTILYAGKWMFTVIPTYALPLGASKVTLPSGTYTEKLKNTFFIELDACFRRPRSQFIK